MRWSGVCIRHLEPLGAIQPEDRVGGSVLSVMPAEQLSRNDDSHANWCFIPVPVHDVIATQEGMELESEPETPVPMCTSALDVIPSDLLMGTDGAEVASDGIEVAVGHLPSDLPPEVTAEDCFDPYLHPPSGSELPSPHATPSDSPAPPATWVARNPAGMSKPEHDLPCNDDARVFGTCPLIHLNPVGLCSLGTPFPINQMQHDSLHTQVISSKDRQCILHNQGMLWADDEVSWHAHNVVEAAQAKRGADGLSSKPIVLLPVMLLHGWTHASVAPMKKWLMDRYVAGSPNVLVSSTLD